MKDELCDGLVDGFIVMDWRIVFTISEVFLIIRCACSSKLPPPQHVKVESSVLTWIYGKVQVNVTYAVQYNTTLTDWRDVYSGTQQQFNFTATAEDFYGKRFRVRSERENQTSDWELSELVQCAHLHTCAPILEVKVETDMVRLRVKHRDQSLREKKGGHLSLQLLYWKRNHTNDELQELPMDSTHIIEDLDSGEEYCFQVEYLVFYKPHGKPSPEICEVIPETSKERNIRVVIIGVLTVAGLAVLGVCLYFLYVHHKRIKALLQPPLDIPEHFEEFLFSDFSRLPASYHPGSQATESYEFVCSVVEVAEDKGGRDMENANSA
ncbi:interferon gamma receptor 2 [Neoarius graeffei]|uniref:interferon gamma receptor 2 n=1 Tax=Neoarius graeffei TaxID=443677 RepID=UPI00298BFD67|nr:interferon gamma receptor 2 [Neoarius graeffei]